MSKEMKDEQQDLQDPDSNIDITTASIIHNALNNAYIGGDERRDPLTEAEMENLIQQQNRTTRNESHATSSSYAFDYTPKSSYGFMQSDYEPSELSSMSEVDYNSDASMYLMPDQTTTSNKLKQIEKRSLKLSDQDRKQRKKEQDAIRYQRKKEAKKLKDELLNIGTTTTKPTRPRPKEIEALPPGMTYPNTTQGQQRYIPKDDFTMDEKHDDSFDFKPVKKRFSNQELKEKMKGFAEKLGNLVALKDGLIDQYGGLEAYLNVILDFIQAGVEPEDALSQTLEGLQEALLEKEEQFSFDKEAFKKFIDPDDMMDGDRFDEIYNDAKETVINEIGDNRDENKMNIK